MGRDIARTTFSDEDFLEFKRRLREETQILMQWFQNESFDSHPCKCGFELEAWLINDQFQPAPKNEEFLSQINHAMVVPELAKFNFEIKINNFDIQSVHLNIKIDDFNTKIGDFEIEIGNFDIKIDDVARKIVNLAIEIDDFDIKSVISIFKTPILISKSAMLHPKGLI